MEQPSDRRKAIITAALRQSLNDYLNFRHVFRHAYAFDLQWPRMANLVAACTATLDRLDTELEAFFFSPR